MTDDERAAMVKHVQYWTEQARENKVLVFGPVADPEGAFGIAILSLEEAGDAEGPMQAGSCHWGRSGVHLQAASDAEVRPCTTIWLIERRPALAAAV